MPYANICSMSTRITELKNGLDHILKVSKYCALLNLVIMHYKLFFTILIRHPFIPFRCYIVCRKFAMYNKNRSFHLRAVDLGMKMLRLMAGADSDYVVILSQLYVVKVLLQCYNNGQGIIFSDGSPSTRWRFPTATYAST